MSKRVNFELAMLAQQKGFDGKVKKGYFNDGTLSKTWDAIRVEAIGRYTIDVEDSKYDGMSEDEYNQILNYNQLKVACKAPTYTQLQKWFRVEHNITIAVLPYKDTEAEVEELSWVYSVVDLNEDNDILFNEVDLGASELNYKSYNAALKDALLETLKSI